MKKTQVFLATLVIIVVGAVIVAAFYFANRIDAQDRFSVTGSGTVYAKADIASLTVGLKTEVKKTAAEATKNSTEKMNAIVEAVKSLGVDSKDIKTTDYQLSPMYNWTEKDGQKLIGYQVSQNVTLKIRDLEKIGDIISRTTEEGANQVGNIGFTIDDEYDLKNQARALAIEKAKEKATMIANESGLKLGKITGFFENSSSYVPMMDYSNVRVEMKSLGGGEAVSSPSIESGQNEVKVEVTLTYKVK
ncbi:MAG TPA: SIMPL domain-containing protein [Candidatus Saccharimonadales bacterium]|nr:SIMPL domain-containing protein [Candidatus Saccharimonadales bacterium]